jgi:hypothetical protein
MIQYLVFVSLILLSFLSRDIEYIVSPNKAVPILGFELSIQAVLFRLLHGNIQIAIQARQYTAVFNSRIQLDSDGTTQNGF